MEMGEEISNRGKTVAILAVVFGSCLFGFMCIFVRNLGQDNDIPSPDIAVLRLLITTIALFIIMLVIDRGLFRISKKDIPFFFIFGLFKFLCDVTFFYGLGQISVTLATLLGMTAPYFVMVISFFLFREKITSQKLVAVLLASAGCVMVTGILFEKVDFNIGGCLSALLSGLFYATYFIGGKMGHDRGYSPQTILFYMFFFGLLSALVYSAFTSDLPATFSKMGRSDVLVSSLVLGILMTLVPYYLFTYGSTKISASVISMISVLELVVASIVGYAVYDEPMDAVRVIGMVLVIGSIIIADINIARYLRKLKEGLQDAMELLE